jgi:hypothetical protein
MIKRIARWLWSKLRRRRERIEDPWLKKRHRLQKRLETARRIIDGIM